MPGEKQRAVSPSESLLERLNPFSEEKRFTRAVKRRRIEKAGFEDIGVRPPAGEDFANPMGPMAGVTRYMTGKRPSMIKRMVGTERFKKSAEDFGKEVHEAALEFARRYPRIAAHMRTVAQSVNNPESWVQFGKRGERGLDKLATPVEIGVGKSALEKQGISSYYSGLTADEAKREMYKAGTRVAQELGMGSNKIKSLESASERAMSELYPGGLGKDEWYRYNPLQISQDVASARKMGQKVEQYRLYPGMEALVEELPVTSSTRQRLEDVLFSTKKKGFGR